MFAKHCVCRVLMFLENLVFAVCFLYAEHLVPALVFAKHLVFAEYLRHHVKCSYKK